MMLADRWTIGTRLHAGLAAFLLLTGVAGGVAIWGSSRIRADVDTITRRSAELQLALTIQTALSRIESSEKSMLWAALDSDRPRYETAKTAVMNEYENAAKQVEWLAASLAGDGDRAAAAAIRQNLNAWKTIHAEIVELSDSGRVAVAQQIVNTKASAPMKAAEDSIRSMVRRHEEAMSEAKAQAATSQSRAELFIEIIIVMALLVGLVAMWLVRAINSSLRSVSRELGDGAQLVVDASSQMSVSAQSLSQGASEQAASLEETSASMEEMTSMTRGNADNSHHAATLMAEAARVVESSNTTLTDMITSMASIKDSSNRVSKIIKTIDEIAFQTNILALNAAVEAARAGEAGMGFAVVADEVRNLAQRSAQAARDTASLIEEGISSASRGSEKVEQLAGAFGAITQRVNEVKDLVDHVSAACKHQTLGIDQVLQSIRQIEKVTQTTAATAEESAAACEQLNTQADTTMQLVERLEAMVGRNGAQEEDVSVPSPLSSRAQASGIWPVATHPARRRGIVPDDDDEMDLSETGTFGKF